ARRGEERRARLAARGMTEAPPPSRRYAEGAARGDWQHDPAQQPALVALDRLHAALLAPVQAPGMLARLFGAEAPLAPRGLYLWGGVGRGKTSLFDLFLAGLPIRERRRTLFTASCARCTRACASTAASATRWPPSPGSGANHCA